MKNKKILFIIVLAVVILAVLIIVHFSHKNVFQEEQVIKIGALFPLTGNLGYFGEQERAGMLLAVEDANKKYSDQMIKPIFEDHKGDPKDGVAAFNKLVSTQNVKIFLTQISNVTMSLLPLIDENRAALMTLAMHPDINRNSKGAIRIYESIIQESEALTKYIWDEGLSSIGIFYVNDVWGEEAKSSFVQFYTSLSGTIAFTEAIDAKDKDFRSVIQRAIGRTKVKGIFLATYGPISIPLTKQIREVSPEVKLFGNLAIAWRSIREGMGDAGVGIELVMPEFLPEERMNTPFVQRYMKLTGKIPEYEAAFTYDAVMISLEALQKLQPYDFKKFDGEKFINSILRLGTYEGVQGTYLIHTSKEVCQQKIAVRRISSDLSLQTIRSIEYTNENIDKMLSNYFKSR